MFWRNINLRGIWRRLFLSRGKKKQEYFVSHEVFGGMPSSRGLALSWRIIAPVQNLLTTSPTVSPISSQAKAVPVLFYRGVRVADEPTVSTAARDKTPPPSVLVFLRLAAASFSFFLFF
jgi:hypothetical protein